MSDDSSNINTTEPINISPPSMETVEFYHTYLVEKVFLIEIIELPLLIL